MSRAPEFDGLRGVAIGMVVWHHLFAPWLPANTLSPLGWLRAGTDIAWTGVDLFFVLSGFFIGGILLDRWQSPRFARIFYLRRSLRILPLYYISLAAIFAAIWMKWPGAYHSQPPAYYLLFLTNFGLAQINQWDWGPLSVLWSLAVEEQFYLTAPWVMRIITPARVAWLALAMVIGAPLIRVGMEAQWPQFVLARHVLVFARMDTLALGVLVAWAVRTPAAGRHLDTLARHWITVVTLAAAVFALLAVLRFREGEAERIWYGYSLVALVCALVVATVAGCCPPKMGRFLSFHPLAVLGRHSYFIYLWHCLIGVGVIRMLGGAGFSLRTPSDFLVPIAGFAATWLAAALSWHFLEEPLINWSHRYSY